MSTVDASYAGYIAGLNAVYINVDASTDRNEQWLTHNEHAYARVHRLSAFTGNDVDDRMLDDFIAGWVDTAETQLTRFADRYSTYVLAKSTPRGRFNREIKRVQCALTMSHLAAIQLGLDAGWDRFVVSEDDAIPRYSVLRGLVPAPPSGYDVVVHGGAFQLASQRNDDQQYESSVLRRGKPHRWLEIAAPFNALCATTYEVNRVAAQHLIDHFAAHPITFDFGWSFTLEHLRSVVARPAVMVQYGRSDRMKNTFRERVL